MFDLISISDAMKLTYEQKGILIDVRSPEAYRNGHLPMAENVPLDDILDEKYRFDSQLPVFLYCDTGSSSMMAARKL
ncbi:MAG: rhodanese-like domain-containing protein, partial [Anaerobutyricum sp.]|nr:rhodanese-like domain-containing protein [Anaerobutyricum sp.]